MKKPSVLFVEENAVLRQQLRDRLTEDGVQVIEAHEKTKAWREVVENSPEVVLLGSYPADPWDAVKLAKEIHDKHPCIRVILVTRKSSERLAISAIKAGICDYFNYPPSAEELSKSVWRQLSPTFRPLPYNIDGAPPNTGDCREKAVVGQTHAIHTIRTYIDKVALTDSSVLITGETGTGKELVAEMIHRHSHRRDRPFVCVNCAAIPDGLLESELFGHEKGAFTSAQTAEQGQLRLANGGTVFFDEIGDMSPYAQAKILRAVESKAVQPVGGKRSIPLDVRFVSASNQEMDHLMEEGKFRKDLYFRLNVARVSLPPLRERKRDIPLLFDHYLREFNEKYGCHVEGFTEESLEYLLDYDWPGNIRELRNVLEAVFINLRSGQVSFFDLPEDLRRRLSSVSKLAKDERNELLSALCATNGNKSKTAKKLNWSRMTVYRKMAKYHIVDHGAS